MYEVEIKVAADHDAVRERLEGFGAERLGTVTQADTYYDAPHRDFAETDEAFRLRRETRDGETRTRMTYKGPKVDPESKTREEIETGVESGEDAADLVRSLGFEPAAVVEKERTRYRLDGYTVTLDSVDGVGEYVEVEIESDDVETARDGAKGVLAKLGLDPDDQVRRSYLGLRLGDASE